MGVTAPVSAASPPRRWISHPAPWATGHTTRALELPALLRAWCRAAPLREQRQHLVVGLRPGVPRLAAAARVLRVGRGLRSAFLAVFVLSARATSLSCSTSARGAAAAAGCRGSKAMRRARFRARPSCCSPSSRSGRRAGRAPRSSVSDQWPGTARARVTSLGAASVYTAPLSSPTRRAATACGSRARAGRRLLKWRDAVCFLPLGKVIVHFGGRKRSKRRTTAQEPAQT